MKKQDVEDKVRQAFTHATPDALDAVLAGCEGQSAEVTVLAEKRPMPKWARWAAGAAAALLLLAGGGVGLHQYNAYHTVASTVSLDVNPSVEIQVNRRERVLAVVAHNEDGRVILGDMDFAGNSLDVTVNALIGSMLRNGYLNELANSILISVDAQDPDVAAALQAQLTEEVNALLQTQTFNGAILSQTVSADDKLQQLSATYGITLGKARLIEQIASHHPFYALEDLAALSINELNLLSTSCHLGLEDVASLGTASDKAYIGVEQAKQAALTHAGVPAADATAIKVELDCEQGVMVYEVSFNASGYEYEYDVDAMTGAICKQERDDDAPASSPTQQPGDASTLLRPDEAQSAALAHAGLTASDVQGLHTKLDDDDHAPVYEVEFTSGGYEYEYDVDAVTGAILHADKEPGDHSPAHQTHHTPAQPTAAGSAATTPTQPTAAPTQPAAAAATISRSAAQSIALSHAGVSAAHAQRLRVELDDDDSPPVYEVAFEANGYEYDYDVDAATGAILRADKERDD